MSHRGGMFKPSSMIVPLLFSLGDHNFDEQNSKSMTYILEIHYLFIMIAIKML